jgi:hypothetical protein
MHAAAVHTPIMSGAHDTSDSDNNTIIMMGRSAFTLHLRGWLTAELKVQSKQQTQANGFHFQDGRRRVREMHGARDAINRKQAAACCRCRSRSGALRAMGQWSRGSRHSQWHPARLAARDRATAVDRGASPRSVITLTIH